MTDQPDLFLDHDAAYVMGALDPQDRRAYEEHLRTCARCSAAVAELAGMPGLLAQVPAEQVLAPRVDPEPVPETLLPRLAGAVRRQRLRRRVWGGLAGTAAAACLVAGTVLLTGSTDPVKPPAGPSLAMTALRPVPVTATVQLDPVAWGTRLNLECAYREGNSSSGGDWGTRTYRLVVVPRDGGQVQQVAQWKALPGKSLTMPGSTNLTTAQIADIRLLDSAGSILLHVVPSA